MKPEFVDNREGNTVAAAFAEWVGNLRPQEACIATAFFSPAGFRGLREALERIPKVRLLIGAERPPESERPRRVPGDPGEPAFTMRQVGEALMRQEAGLRQERNFEPFNAMAQAAARAMIGYLGSDKVEVRRYRKDFLHAKAYMLRAADKGVLVGSSNFTKPGLSTNLELNIGRHADAVAEKGFQWFEELWLDAESFDLASIYRDVFAEWTPYDVFLLVLWRLFNDELAAEAMDSDAAFQLTQFQKHGVWRALRLIQQRGGALVADEVGLGKTFIAGEIIQRYIANRQRVLLVCPAALRDGTWAKFAQKYQLFIETVSMEELAQDRQINGDYLNLKSEIGQYQLIVVDEAHNYRNPDSVQRAAALRKLLYGQRKDLLLLTATPVNNSLWDLFHLLRFYVKQDAAFAERGVLSMSERFAQAMQVDPFALSPDLLFPIIDATTVKRTREFVKRHYAGEMIMGPDGRPQPIVFPKPHAITVRYQLDDIPRLFDDVVAALDPDGGTMQFARYNANAWLRTRDEDEAARGEATAGLVRSGLLKRFESSIRAFVRTLERIERQHDAFLESIEQGFVPSTEFFDDMDEDTSIAELISGGVGLQALTLFKAKELKAAIEADRKVLRDLRVKLRAVKPDDDPKLAALRSELIKIVQQAAKDSGDAAEAGQQRKVLLFTQYHDTAEYVWEYLNGLLRSDSAVAAYRGRLAAATGGDSFAGMSREEAVSGFAPVSTETQGAKDLYDILVATDVLAEGLNLQQARHIINLDLPWNPMRLVQRHGRIDRIGSAHDDVYLRTFFPDDRLEELLELEARILAKLALAAASIGVGTRPVAGARQGGQVFAETRDEIDALYREDASLFERGGTANAGQTGEEYRQLVRKEMERDPERLANMPWKIGSGLVSGREQGVFFCAAVGDRTYTRFVRTDSAWRMRDGAEAILSELGTCLRLIECKPDTPRVLEDTAQEAVFGLWDKAAEHIYETWTAETDPAALQPRVPAINRIVAEFIRKNSGMEIDQSGVARALDVVEQKWQVREERELRAQFNEDSDTAGAKAARLVKYILDTGIEPFQAPEPLPPIEREEIHLICWMAVKSAEPTGEQVKPIR